MRLQQDLAAQDHAPGTNGFIEQWCKVRFGVKRDVLGCGRLKIWRSCAPTDVRKLRDGSIQDNLFQCDLLQLRVL